MIRPSEQVILHPGHLVKHVPAVEPTTQAEGNTEYWECDRCGLVFADAGLAQVIEKADTVLPKLERLRRPSRCSRRFPLPSRLSLRR